MGLQIFRLGKVATSSESGARQWGFETMVFLVEVGSINFLNLVTLELWLLPKLCWSPGNLRGPVTTNSSSASLISFQERYLPTVLGKRLKDSFWLNLKEVERDPVVKGECAVKSSPVL